MWKLNRITGSNVASLKDLDLTLNQSVTTLIFGHNTDNLDNQPSNGSGKSALIEAIAIAITGEPLRKVNIDEIINDYANDMEVCAYMVNEETGATMKVMRKFSRKSPQSISIFVNDKEIPTASVLDAGKIVLDMIGLTKDEIYHNFILTEQKYESFFAAKDRDKKEIINKFSNAQIVDVALESLQEDIIQAQNEANNANLVVEKANSAVGVLSEQIDKLKATSSQASDKREARKKEIEAQIAYEREEKRLTACSVSDCETKLQSHLNTKHALKALEAVSDVSIDEYVQSFLAFGIEVDVESVKQDIKRLSDDIKSFEQNIEATKLEIDTLAPRIDSDKKMLDGMRAKFSLEKEEHQKTMADYATRVDELEAIIENCENKKRSLSKTISDIETEIENAKIKLHGEIKCPKCGHVFFVNSEDNPEDIRQLIREDEEELADKKAMLDLNKKTADDAETKCAEITCNGRRASNHLRDSELEIDRVAFAIQKMERTVANLNDSIERYNSCIDDAKYKISKVYERIYEMACDMLAKTIRDCETRLAYLQQSVKNHEGKIAGYEIELEELSSVRSNDEYIVALNQELDKKNKELDVAILDYNTKAGILSNLATLEKRMIRFKSKLANTKINAMSQSINSILEQLGSDLRVRIDGFQILKNGNVREKISVSILRNGMEFGSYYKLSRGERCRIDVACIISMQSLINDSAGDGKGLGLLVLDEVLSNVDELGLMDIYEALNRMQQTCLVVSHNQVSASYPYKLTVTKSNGVSTINA